MHFVSNTCVFLLTTANYFATIAVSDPGPCLASTHYIYSDYCYTADLETAKMNFVAAQDRCGVLDGEQVSANIGNTAWQPGEPNGALGWENYGVIRNIVGGGVNDHVGSMRPLCMFPLTVGCSNGQGCANGGSCIQKGGSGSEICLCANGYTGLMCEKTMSEWIGCLKEMRCFDGMKTGTRICHYYCLF